MFGGFGGILPVRLTPGSTTGWAASQQSRAAADLVGLKRAAPLAVVTFTSSGGGVTVHACWTMVEIGTVSEFAPTLTRSSTGVVVVTFEPQFLDEYDISAPIDIRHAKVTGHGSTCLKSSVELVSPNSVRVRLYNSAGTATDGKATLKLC